MTTEAKEEANEAHSNVVFVVEVLTIIKECQQQHGLRHGDFHRYRQYVTRKLRRMRKSLHFPKGTKYRVQPKKLSAELLASDQRFLLMQVFEAERAWAYAMQLKPESNTEPRKRFHMISRFRKAVALAEELAALTGAAAGCDARTKLECQAYASWMRGNLLFELQRFAAAREALSAAQTIYSRLADLLEEGPRQIYCERVRELEPQLRYCLFETEGDTSAVEALKAMRAAGGAGAVAMEQLDHLIAQTRADQAATVVEVTWGRHNIAVRLEKPRLVVSSLREWEAELDACETADARLSLFETILKEVTEALQTVREEAQSPGAAGDAAAGAASNLQLLQQYLQFAKLLKTAERNRALLAVSRTRSPQELARLYDAIVQSLQEIRALPAVADEPGLQNELEAKIVGFRAYRCYNLSKAYQSVKKFAECTSLLQRALQHCRRALDTLSTQGADALDRIHLAPDQLEQLARDVDAEIYACRAAKLIDAVSVGSSDQDKAGKELLKKPLIERLDVYVEDPALAGGRRTPAHAQPLLPLPPDFTPIPAKPVFFDLANNHVDFPSLDAVAEAAPTGGGGGLTGLVRGWIGWGGKK